MDPNIYDYPFLSQGEKSHSRYWALEKMLKSSWGSSINDVLLSISLIIKSVIVDVGLSIIIENCVKSFMDEPLDQACQTQTTVRAAQ